MSLTVERRATSRGIIAGALPSTTGRSAASPSAVFASTPKALSASWQVDFIDFEMDNDPGHVRRVRESSRSNEVRLILSYHNFSYTPGLELLVQRFLEAERRGADVALVAVTPRDRMDVLTLLAATAQADDKTHIPLVSMSMGPLGSVTRMIGGLFGSGLDRGCGEIAFGALQADLDIEYSRSSVGFTWEGFDEMDEVSGDRCAGQVGLEIGESLG